MESLGVFVGLGLLGVDDVNGGLGGGRNGRAWSGFGGISHGDRRNRYKKQDQHEGTEKISGS